MRDDIRIITRQTSIKKRTTDDIPLRDVIRLKTKRDVIRLKTKRDVIPLKTKTDVIPLRDDIRK